MERPAPADAREAVEDRLEADPGREASDAGADERLEPVGAEIAGGAEAATQGERPGRVDRLEAAPPGGKARGDVVAGAGGDGRDEERRQARGDGGAAGARRAVPRERARPGRQR